MNCNNNFNLFLNSNSCNDGLRHIEQIALNKAGIDCLNGRVSRAESDIKERYTKVELDRMLSCKMDKCRYGRPHHHGNGKPSICDYYTKEELDQLLAEIACKCDTYSKEELDELLNKIACTCDSYSKEEIDELLSNKVNKGLPGIYNLSLAEGLTVVGNYAAIYYKSALGEVTVTAGIFAEAGLKTGHIATLPVGFRPAYRIDSQTYVTDGNGESAKYYNAYTFISPDGSIVITLGEGQTGTPRLCSFSFTFLAEE